MFTHVQITETNVRHRLGAVHSKCSRMQLRTCLLAQFGEIGAAIAFVQYCVSPIMQSNPAITTLSVKAEKFGFVQTSLL